MVRRGLRHNRGKENNDADLTGLVDILAVILADLIKGEKRGQAQPNIDTNRRTIGRGSR